MDRPSAYKFRSELTEIQQSNLNEMDHSIFVVSFDFNEPANDEASWWEMVDESF